MHAHSLRPRQILTLGLWFWMAPLLVSAAMAQAAPPRINLVVVQGEDGIHDNGSSTPSDIAVRVVDDDHQPIAGASVAFALPISGSSGMFLNNSLTFSTLTDRNGMAWVRRLKVNTVPGKFLIYVTASYGGMRSETFITQFIKDLPAGAKTHSFRTRAFEGRWKWIVLAAAAAGAAGGSVYYLNTRSAASPSSVPISVTAGSVQFGSPR